MTFMGGQSDKSSAAALNGAATLSFNDNARVQLKGTAGPPLARKLTTEEWAQWAASKASTGQGQPWVPHKTRGHTASNPLLVWDQAGLPGQGQSHNHASFPTAWEQMGMVVPGQNPNNDSHPWQSMQAQAGVPGQGHASGPSQLWSSFQGSATNHQRALAAAPPTQGGDAAESWTTLASKGRTYKQPHTADLLTQTMSEDTVQARSRLFSEAQAHRTQDEGRTFIINLSLEGCAQTMSLLLSGLSHSHATSQVRRPRPRPAPLLSRNGSNWTVIMGDAAQQSPPRAFSMPLVRASLPRV